MFFQDSQIEQPSFSLALLNTMPLQMIHNKMKSPAVFPVSLAEHLQVLKEMCFICNNKCISDKKTYDESDLILFATDNSLIILRSIYVIISMLYEIHCKDKK